MKNRSNVSRVVIVGDNFIDSEHVLFSFYGRVNSIWDEYKKSYQFIGRNTYI